MMNWQSIVQMMIGLTVVSLSGIAGIFFSSWMWPLPKGQGFAYVAHPFFALVGCIIAAVAAAVLGAFYPNRWGVLLAAAIAATWIISGLIFLSA